MRLAPFFALLLLATLLPPSAPAQDLLVPPNDARSAALLVPADGFVFAQRTDGATLEPSEGAPCESLGATVWFAYRAVSTGDERVTTHGSSFDTVLAVYVSTPFGLFPLGCSDDAPSAPNGVTSEVRFRAVSGATYYFQAGGYAGSTGTLALRLAPAAVPA